MSPPVVMLTPVLACATVHCWYTGRRASFTDGAALVYTSAKDGVNCGLLHRYILSCLYPGAFSCSEEGQVRVLFLVLLLPH